MKATIELIQSIKNIIKNHSSILTKNESLVRYSLIDPILKHLGWDISNPDEIIPEHSIEKKFSDYTIFKNNSKNPFIVIEAKSLNKQFEDKSQIGNYIANSTARFIIFSDGSKWKLFDFKKYSESDHNERIVLDINVLEELENVVAIKLFCLSKENLFSENPFFINTKTIVSQNDIYPVKKEESSIIPENSLKSKNKSDNLVNKNKILKVTFKNGIIIQNKIAKDTFIDTIKAIGIEKVRNINVRNGGPLISDKEDNGYQHNFQKLDSNLFIDTKLSIDSMYTFLLRISKELDENILIEIVPKL